MSSIITQLKGALIALGLVLLPYFPGHSVTEHSTEMPSTLTTLTATPDALSDYHDSGQYDHDLSEAIENALRYLRFRMTQHARQTQPKPLAIVMTVDETALSNYDDLKKLNFNFSASDIEQVYAQAHARAIPYTKALYDYARRHHIAIFFVTHRKEHLRHHTTTNLHRVGYDDWEGLYMLPDDQTRLTLQRFKLETHKKILTLGYDIALDLENQLDHVESDYADMSVTLPNPYYQNFK